MSQVRYHVDEHIARAVVNGLRRRGIDVTMPAEMGMRGRSDADQLAFATAADRVIVTRDQDYLRLHAASAEHAGIVFIQAETGTGAMIRGLTLIFQVLDAEDMLQHVEFI